jgi:hypothetical protein
VASVTGSPAKYCVEMGEAEAVGLLAISRLDCDAMLRALRKEMGNNIVPTECDAGLHLLFKSCRSSIAFEHLLPRDY